MLNTLAWAASVGIVSMYLLSSLKKNPLILHLTNIFGGAFLATDNAHLNAWPAFSLNIAFILVGAIGVLIHIRAAAHVL